jgi:gliding motility-associated-like protein
MIRYLFALLLVCTLYSNSHAQVDTSFWFAAPDISASMGESPVDLHIQTYSVPVIVYVRQPANPTGVNITFTVPVNTTSVIALTPSLSSIECAVANSTANAGLYISTTGFVSAYYTIGAGSNKEMISLKGQRAKGIDFYMPVPNSIITSTIADAGVGFDVVATNTGVTTLLITPKAACVGRAKNVTFAVSLTQGQTFSMKDNKVVSPSELAGSIISADQPISVTLSGAVRTTTSCHSYYADQITTSDNIGKDYVIIPGEATTDMAYILAPVNGTSLTISNSTTTINWLINSGETYSFNTSSLTYIKTDKPVYVMHLSGYGCKLSGAQVTPAYCAGSYTTNFVRLSSDSLNLNLYTRAGYQNSFTLTSNGTGVPISGASFTTVPGTGGALVAARLYFPVGSIPVGSHNVLRNNQDIFGLGVNNGGTTGGSAYAYTTQFGITSFALANSTPSVNVCANTTFNLNGLIGGGPITGFWSYNGFGSLSGPSTQYTNNIYTPALIDTTIKPTSTVTLVGGYLYFTLTSTGICPNVSSTFTMHVTQPPIVSAGTASTICSNNATVQLNGNVTGATNQGIWNVVAPGSGSFSPSVSSFSPSYIPSNADTALNIIKIVLTSTNNAGCNAERDTLRITMNHAPLVTSSLIKPILRCANNPTVFLSGTVSGTTTSTGKWTTSGTGIFFPNNLSLICNYLPSLADIATGSVSVKLESTNNLQCKKVQDSVTIIFTQPVSVNLGVDLNSCKNNPITPLNAIISGTATNTGIWYGGLGTFTNTNTSLTPTYVASPGEVTAGFVILTFSTTNNGLCNGVSDQIKIEYRNKPTAGFNVNSVCLNQASVFNNTSVDPSGIGITSYNWSFGDGGSAITPTAINTYSTSGSFTAQLVVANGYNCYDTINKMLTIYPLPTPSMQVTRACSGSSLQINFTDLSSVAPPSTIPSNGGYFWDLGGFGSSITKDTSVIFPGQGLYSITHIVTTNFGCKATVTQSVNVTPKPQANFTWGLNNTPSLISNVDFSDQSISAATWSWNFGNGLISNQQNPSTTYTANGTYTVSLTITDAFGCNSIFSSTLTISNVVSEITQLIPNIITPNNDGQNDIWRLDFIEVYFKTAEITIYNRWGEQLFKSTGYSNAWDGSYKGNPLPVGAYFYTINLNDPKQPDIFKGTITLLK